MDEKKVREAIEELKSNIQTCKVVIVYAKDYGMKTTCEMNEVKIQIYETAIEALEKQLPKKVEDKSLVKDNDIVVGAVGRCPCCNEIIDDTTNICDCGQKLDWSEAH